MSTQLLHGQAYFAGIGVAHQQLGASRMQLLGQGVANFAQALNGHSRLGSDNLEGLRVAIQGLGKVGYALAEQLHAAGAELQVCDTDPGKVRLVMEQFGAHPVACEALLSTPCDILAPCGLGGVLTAMLLRDLMRHISSPSVLLRSSTSQ